MVARSIGGNNKNLPNYTGLQVQTSALGVPIMIGWGKNRGSFNLIWWNDFKKHKESGKGKGGGGKATNYTYTVASLMSIGWGEVSAVDVVYINQSKTTLADLGLTLFNGTAAQTPYSYVVAKHPDQALSYPNIAYLATSSLQLGHAPTLPSMSFEYTMNLSGSMPGTPDANLGDIIPDFLTNSLYGMGLDVLNIGLSIDFYKTYVQAEGLFMSPMLVTQEKATEIINRWAKLTNSWIFWSGNEMKFVPLGTEAITAHSVTYTPVIDVRFHLGVEDFLDSDGPVTVDRIDPADAYNTTRVEIKDRALDYNSNPVEYKDQTLIDQYGLKDTSVTASEITTLEVGLRVATLIGKRNAYLRNEYSWRTNHRFVALEPGDIVTLTDPTIPAMTFLPVRIKTVDCDESGDLSFTAEDYTGDLGNFVDSVIEEGVPITFDKLVAPGDINSPMILEPRSDLATPPQLWIACSGGENWGGCNVWISADDVTYGMIGNITAPAAQGVLTAILPNVADPDTTSTLQIDLASSVVQLNPSVTHADADAKRTTSYLTTQPVAQVVSTVGELISYGEITPTGEFTDDLEYLRRGLYGTLPASHASGDQFTSVDLTESSGSILKYQLPAQYIGVVLYLKFPSFNLYNLNTQDISSVSAYQFTTTGTGFGAGTGGVPGTPTGLAAAAGSSSNMISWSSNPSTDNVTEYKLYRATGTGAAFGSSVAIWQGLATNYQDTNVTTGAGYTYFLSAINVVGEGGHTAGVDSTTSTFTRPLRICAGTPDRKPVSGEVLFTIPMKTGDALPANLAGSLLKIETANGGVAPTSTWTVVLEKNNSTIFTGTIAAAGVTGSFGAASAATFTDGDFLSATCITPQDATCEGVSLTIIGTRTQ